MDKASDRSRMIRQIQPNVNVLILSDASMCGRDQISQSSSQGCVNRVHQIRRSKLSGKRVRTPFRIMGRKEEGHDRTYQVSRSCPAMPCPTKGDVAGEDAVIEEVVMEAVVAMDAAVIEEVYPLGPGIVPVTGFTLWPRFLSAVPGTPRRLHRSRRLNGKAKGT